MAHDRKHELIIRGGYHAYPMKIEEVLHDRPAVQKAAVIGIPHPELDEEAGAAGDAQAGGAIVEVELRDYMKASVGAYKYPPQVWFVPELPKGPTGKILKRETGLLADLAGAATGGV